MDAPLTTGLDGAERLRLEGVVRADPDLGEELRLFAGELDGATRLTFLRGFLERVPDYPGRPAAAVLPALVAACRRPPGATQRS